MLHHTYYNTALSFVKSYAADAESSDLVHDCRQEELTIRVIYSVPAVYQDLLEAVDRDNA